MLGNRVLCIFFCSQVYLQASFTVQFIFWIKIPGYQNERSIFLTILPSTGYLLHRLRSRVSPKRSLVSGGHEVVDGATGGSRAPKQNHRDI